MYRGHPLLSCAGASKNLTRMLCKGCGDELEDGNRYAYAVNSKVYRSNCCRGCKRGQVLATYYLKKQHLQPPSGSPCECCGRIAPLQLDHDHSTGAYRGHLCRLCNISIGGLQDSIEGVTRALAYLTAAKERESCSTQRENGIVAPERSDRQL